MALVGGLTVIAVVSLGLVGYMFLNNNKKDENKTQKAEITNTQISTQTNTQYPTYTSSQTSTTTNTLTASSTQTITSSPIPEAKKTKNYKITCF